MLCNKACLTWLKNTESGDWSHGTLGIFSAETWSVAQQERMVALPRGCLLNTLRFQSWLHTLWWLCIPRVDSANKLSKVQRVPFRRLQGSSGMSNTSSFIFGWICVACQGVDRTWAGNNVYLYLHTIIQVSLNLRLSPHLLAARKHLQFFPPVIPGLLWLGLDKWKGTQDSE